MKSVFKAVILMLIGGCTYYGIEICFRGYSHWVMGIIGGMCFLACGAVNEILPKDMIMQLQMMIGGLAITAIEFMAGIILNVVMGLHLWDYSGMPFNLLGQICLPFAVLWILLAGVAIVLDDYLRYWMFEEEKPTYKF